MANLSEDIQCAGSDTRPPMCLVYAHDGKHSGKIFLQKGMKATNILLQGLPKDIYSLINHYIDAKGHMGQCEDAPGRMQLNSKFVNNMLPEWGRFVTAVKLNRGLRDSNYDQLYAYLKQHETHANEKQMMLERFTQPNVDPSLLIVYVFKSSRLSPTDNLIENLTNTLALLTQSYKTYLPQTNNQLRTSSNPRNQVTVQEGRVVVQNVQGLDRIETGCYTAKLRRLGVAMDEEQLLFLAGGQDNVVDEDVDEQPIQDLALNVDNVFQADNCDAFDSDVDEAPTIQTIFIANLSFADPVYDEASTSYDSDVLSEVYDNDHYQYVVCKHHEIHKIHDYVQPNYAVDSHVDDTSDSNMILYDQYVKDNTVPVVQNNVLSVPNDAYLMILNDIYESSAQWVSLTSQNNVVDNSLSAELATYKEQVKLYERRIGSMMRLSRKNLLIANDNLIADCLSKEVFYIATNSELTVSRFTEMHEAHTIVQTRCLELEAELSKLRDKVQNDDHTELVKSFSNLESVKPRVLAPGRYAIDVEPIPPHNRNNREVHLHYLKHLKESVETLREIVEEAKVERPFDRSLASACLYTKHSQELLEYAIATCPKDFNQRDKKHAPTPLIMKKQVTFKEKCDTSNRVNCCTNASGSQPRSNTKKNRISPAKGVNKKKVEEHPRTNKSNLRTTNRVDSSSSSKRTVINSNSDSVCQTCNKCLISTNHDVCVVDYLQSVKASPSIHNIHNVVRKVKQVWKPKQVRQVWKPTGKVLTSVGYQWRPTGRIFTLGEQFPLTRLTKPKVTPAKQNENQAITCANQQEPNQN
ncbi:hypothetical protein Tco_1185343 [Tanacetum coccineum]